MILNSKILSKEECIAEFAKPQYGNGSQTLEEILPVLPEKVKERIPSPFFEWHDYDPNDESTHPTANPYEIWPDAGLNGNAMYWECEISNPDGALWQGGGTITSLHEERWSVMGVKRYRRFKQAYESASIPNPLYPIIKAERDEKTAVYSAVIRSLLVPFGMFQFQGLPVHGNYEWSVDGQKVERSHEYRLATDTDTIEFKFIEAPMRNPEIMHVNHGATKTEPAGVWVWDMYEKTVAGAIARTLDVKPYNLRINSLLR
jgi:hypothetical protein